MTKNYIHKFSHVEEDVSIGQGTKIWINAQVRSGAKIGKDCVISKDTFIDSQVIIGDNCKIQNGVSIYNGVKIDNEVFIGPNVTFTNDKIPRAFNRNWSIVNTYVKNGASIGANATLVCGIVIGEYAMIAAGSVVTKDVEPYSLVMGNPARHYYYIDKEGKKILND